MENETIKQFSERMVEKLCVGMPQTQKELAADYLKEGVKYLLHDAISLAVNINKTSLPGEDLRIRSSEFEKVFGVHLYTLVV